MCGIACVLLKDQAKKGEKRVAEAVHDIFEDQQGRGIQGFGITKIGNKGGIKVIRSTEPVSMLINLKLDCGGAKGILLHHRQPTSTPNKIGQTHPIFVSNELLKHDYLVVHNGVIHNETERKKAHEDLKFVYTTQMDAKVQSYRSDFNDSEAIAIDFALAIEGMETEIKSRGSAALVAVQIDKEKKTCKKIFLWRATNPLNYLETEEAFFFSSQGPGKELPSNRLFSIDFATNTTIEEALKQAEYINNATPYGRPASEIGFPLGNHYTWSNKLGKSWKKENGRYIDIHGKELAIHEIQTILKDDKVFDSDYKWSNALNKRYKKNPNGVYVNAHGMPLNDEELAKLKKEIAPEPITTHAEKLMQEVIEKQKDEPVDWDDLIDSPKSGKVLEDLDDNNEAVEEATAKVEDLFQLLGAPEEVWTLEAKKELQKTLSTIAKLFLTKYEKDLNTVAEALKVQQLTKNDKKDEKEDEGYIEPQYSFSISKHYRKDPDGIYRDLHGVSLTAQEQERVEEEEEFNLQYGVENHAND